MGTLELHGKQFHPTWTRLARSAGAEAEAGENSAISSIIFLQEPVNWEVGRTILVTTTILLDCNDEKGKTSCVPCEAWEVAADTPDKGKCVPVKHQNEERRIVALGQSPHLPSGSRTLFSALQLDRPLSHRHYAGPEYQAEVALLSRRITVSGTEDNPPTEKFGAHLAVHGSNSEGRISGVSCRNCGQLNQIARYPFHFHSQKQNLWHQAAVDLVAEFKADLSLLCLFARASVSVMGNSVGASRSFVQDCSVVHSHFRAFVIHGSNHTRLSRNVGFDITGQKKKTNTPSNSACSVG